jgi:multiple sugar transport system substrate-binding protein
MRDGSIGRRHVLGGLASGIVAGAVTPARAATPVQLISHRYPALEFWAAKMKASVPGVEVNAQLVPFDKALELTTIALSSKADTIDIAYASDATLTSFAKNGWIRPLDDLWAKYKEQYKLGDIADEVMKIATYNGHIYMIPANINLMLFFYRKDLFDKAGKQPPKTLAEYQELAKSFNTPLRAGTISCLRPVDATMNEADWYMHVVGPGWFDDKWRPLFNTDRGIRAIEALKETTRFAQRGFTSAANDECSIALQQDAAAMGLQWATRAGSMDDARQSHVVGKMEWTAPPQGHGRFSSDGYTISAFSKQDPDLLFRVVAGAITESNMREGASLTVPTRKAILEDPAMQQKNRYYPAASDALKTAEPYPQLPEFYAVGEFIARRIVQAVTGEMPVKPAMDAAAAETVKYLKDRGYAL